MISSHKPSDLPELCESFNLTPQKQTAGTATGIVNDFVECLCHQSSKLTTARQANIRCRDQKQYIYQRIMDEQLCSRILGDCRVLKHSTYKFTIRKTQMLRLLLLCLLWQLAELLAPGLRCLGLVKMHFFFYIFTMPICT